MRRTTRCCSSSIGMMEAGSGAGLPDRAPKICAVSSARNGSVSIGFSLAVDHEMDPTVGHREAHLRLADGVLPLRRVGLGRHEQAEVVVDGVADHRLLRRAVAATGGEHRPDVRSQEFQVPRVPVHGVVPCVVQVGRGVDARRRGGDECACRRGGQFGGVVGDGGDVAVGSHDHAPPRRQRHRERAGRELDDPARSPHRRPSLGEHRRVVDDDREARPSSSSSVPVDGRLRELAADGRMVAVQHAVAQDRERAAAAVGRVEAGRLPAPDPTVRRSGGRCRRRARRRRRRAAAAPRRRCRGAGRRRARRRRGAASTRGWRRRGCPNTAPGRGTAASGGRRRRRGRPDRPHRIGDRGVEPVHDCPDELGVVGGQPRPPAAPTRGSVRPSPHGSRPAGAGTPSVGSRRGRRRRWSAEPGRRPAGRTGGATVPVVAAGRRGPASPGRSPGRRRRARAACGCGSPRRRRRRAIGPATRRRRSAPSRRRRPARPTVTSTPSTRSTPLRTAAARRNASSSGW